LRERRGPRIVRAVTLLLRGARIETRSGARTTPEAGRVQGRILLLDSLRGLAALVVMFHHVRTLFAPLDAELAASSPALHAAARWVSARNVEAVLLFFVLSGFSIRLSVEQRPLTEPTGVLDYVARRAHRILPLYLLALFVAGAVAATVAPVPAQALSGVTLIGNLLFLQTAVGVPGAWFLPYAGNGPLWSLSFEVFFYAAYPLLVCSVAAPARRALCVLGASALGYAACLVWPSPPAMFCAAGLIWYLGVELAELYLRGRAAFSLRAFVALFAASIALRLGAGGALFHGAVVGCALFLAGAIGLRLAPRLTGLHARLRRALLEPLARVGAISYGLYLLHVPVLRAFAAVLGASAASAVLACACSLACAYTAERAAARLPRRFLQTPRAPGADSALT
jgi:peptidoglycan/LPS O-acetylase OafA/YrhL